MGNSISQYISGAISSSDFKKDLLQNDIDFTPNLKLLLRKQEAGEHLTYTKLGKEIFQQIELKEGQNANYIRSENAGNNGALKYAREKPKKTQLQGLYGTNEDTQIEYEQRHLGQTYVPKKSKPK